MIEANVESDQANEHTGMEAERARLVRLCAHLTGDADADEQAEACTP